MIRRHPVAMLAITSFSAHVFAHHSDAIYDRETIVALEGSVTNYSWRNPHVLIGIAVTDDSGEETEWLVETGATPIMGRSGWSEDLLSPGDTVTVRIHPERSGRKHAILNTLQTADGNLYRQVEEEAEETVAATSIAGVWRGASDRNIFAIQNQIQRTPAAEAARLEWLANGDDPGRECDSPTPPLSIGSLLYLAEIQILEDRVILRNEFLDSYRTVWIDGREHPADGEFTHMGHSIGHWEGDTLVVDTRYLEENPKGNGWRGVPSSREKHVVERYSLINDGRRLRVDVFVEDPVYIAEPFEGIVELIYTPQLELYDYNCVSGTFE
jgi:hypothetical protein